MSEAGLDARQRRTRQALYAALDSLLAERVYADITVTDLVHRAGVGRQTFYRHFDRIDSMLENSLRDDLAEQYEYAVAQAQELDHPAWVENVTAFAFTFASRQPRLYRLILSGQAGSHALVLFQAQIAAIMRIAPRHPDLAADVEPAARFVHSYYAGAVSALMLEWLESGREASPRDMGRLYCVLSLNDRRA